jgi:hypothetical protein
MKMPAKWFICPDENKTLITDCLTTCRIADQLPAGRCLSLRTLRLIADQREWTGVPSTTQLLKGTREAYLELVTDYALNPQDELWRVHGSKAHQLLEQYHDNALGEIRLTDEICSGQFDFYDPDDQILYDSKTWGSYKIMKAMGLQQVEVETGEVYKSGEKKGKPKTRKEWVEGGAPDLFNEEIQLNDYRMKLEAAGFPVKAMFIEALCRDGNTWMAAKRGIQQVGVLIPIRRLPDEEVKRYLRIKAMYLNVALHPDCSPNSCVVDKCNERENWQGRKCEKYCRVREACQDANI